MQISSIRLKTTFRTPFPNMITGISFSWTYLGVNKLIIIHEQLLQFAARCQISCKNSRIYKQQFWLQLENFKIRILHIN